MSDSIFEARPKHLFDLLSGEVGYYIPAYQRQYAWGKDNIERLFDDLLEGLEQLVDDESTYTFLGAVISIHDTKYETISPIVRGDVPRQVMTLVDGQQRLSTIVTLVVILHNKIQALINKKEVKEIDDNNWMIRVAGDCKAGLEQMLYADTRSPYPKIIKSLDDQWARDDKKIYGSAIASLLYEYIISIEKQTEFRFTHNTSNEEHIKLSKAMTAMKDCLKKYVFKEKKTDDKLSFPSLNSIVESDTLQTALFKSSMDDKARDNLLRLITAEDGDKHLYVVLFKTILTAEFLQKRVDITEVVTTHDRYAFSIFEALNTSGTPLTAFETFKPEVIKRIGLQNYESSRERVELCNIEEKIGNDQNSKDTDTASVIIPFALAETGDKRGKKLSVQRTYLRNSYEDCPEEEKLDYIKLLSNVADLYRGAWKTQPPEFFDLNLPDDDPARLAMSFLRETNHQMALAPLSLFYAAAKAKNNSILFKEAACATAAFAALWKGVHRSTDGIDDAYRAMMKTGIWHDKLTNKEIEFCVPFSRRSRPLTDYSFDSVGDLKEAYRFILTSGWRSGLTIQNSEEWIARASKIEIYKSRAAAKMIMLAGCNHTYPDKDNPGLLLRSFNEDDNSDFLNFKKWAAKEYATVEHIAPQQRNPSWNDDIYLDRDMVHSLGNLTLIPQMLNSIVSNSSWDKKKLCYELCVTKDKDRFNEILTELRQKSKKIDVENILDKIRYMPMLESLTNIQVDFEWTPEFVKKRSRNIAELAWQELSSWLEFEDNF